MVGGLGTLAGCSGGASPSTVSSSSPSTVANAKQPSTPTAPSTSITRPVTNTSACASPTGVDLSAGLTDYGTSNVPFSALAKPAKGQTVNDPDFHGVTITRITDAVADFKADNVIPAYPTCQAFNCDESRFVLYTQGGSGGGQHVMYDGKTYAFIKAIDINPSDIEQFWWDRVDPATMYYLDNRSVSGTYVSQMVAFNVETGVSTVVHDFAADKATHGWAKDGPVRAGYPFFIGGPNNDIWGLGCGGIPNIGGYEAVNVFGWQRSTGKITIYQGLPSAQARTNVPTPLPSGKGWFYNNDSAAAASGYVTDIYNLNGEKTGSVPFSSNEHAGTNQNAAGDDYIVGNQYDTAQVGNMILANLTKGTVKTLIGENNGYGYPRTGTLTASACYNNPGWCVTGMVGDPYTGGKTFLDQEIAIANADTGIVRRVCHHRSAGYYTNAPVNNYWAQPNVTISPSGTRILVQSDWGCGDPSKPVVKPDAVSDTYVITLPSYVAC